MTTKRWLAISAVCVVALLFPGWSRGQQTYAVRGTLVMPEGIVEAGVVLVQDGVIVASGAQVTVPAQVPVIETHGIIAPGFIDLHNHLTWNVFPRWRPIEEFGSRYDWQQKAVYQALVEAPHAALVADGYECRMERYAELKALTEGETSVVGSLQAPCSAGLARNLDRAGELPGGGAGKAAEYNVFPFQMTEEQVAAAKKGLGDGSIAALLIHVAEGAPTDASAAREFAMLKGRGLLVPGVSLIHAGGLKAGDYTELAAHHVGLIWSPRSNVELYGQTANVEAAKRAGVVIALAPDWSITGSDGTLGELNYAAMGNESRGRLFSDRELVRMATENAAALVGQSKLLGSLAPGHLADLLILYPEAPGVKGAPKHDAYWSLTHAGPAQVALVIVGGKALYGDAALLAQWPGTKGKVEGLEICSAAKGVLLTGAQGAADAADETWALSAAALTNAMQHYGRKLAPLSECGQ